MRCQDCKTCLSAIKKGHFECMKTFNYEKCKKAPETAALYNHLEIYNFLKTNPRQISLEKEIEFCAKNKWLDEYYAFLYNYTYFDNEARFSTIRYMMYAAIKHGDLTMMNSVYTYGTTTFHEAFAEIRSMDNATSIAVKTADPEKIESVYQMFWDRSEDWSPSDFNDAIITGNLDVLAKVIQMWKESPTGLVSVENTIKLATITNNRIDMLKLLDREINGYPPGMLHEMRNMRGHSTRARQEMNAYVWRKMFPTQRGNATGIVERDRIEQRQVTAAPVAPVREKVTNLQKALAVIEDCDIPEGKYLELCNLLMDVHKRGVRA